MKNLKFLFLLTLVSVFFGITSCSKEELVKESSIKEDPTQNVEVKNGVLFFENNESFEKFTLFVLNATDTELDRIDEKLGFISARKYGNAGYEAISNISETGTEEEIITIIGQYSDVLELKEAQNGENEVVNKFDVHSGYTDINGVYAIDKSAYKLVGVYIIQTNIENLSFLKTYEFTSMNNVPANLKIIRLNTNSDAKLKYGKCTTTDFEQDFYSKSGSYKLKISMKAFYGVDGGLLTSRSYYELQSWKRTAYIWFLEKATMARDYAKYTVHTPGYWATDPAKYYDYNYGYYITPQKENHIRNTVYSNSHYEPYSGLYITNFEVKGTTQYLEDRPVASCQ